jgi:hypothetical protein
MKDLNSYINEAYRDLQLVKALCIDHEDSLIEANEFLISASINLMEAEAIDRNCSEVKVLKLVIAVMQEHHATMMSQCILGDHYLELNF